MPNYLLMSARIGVALFLSVALAVGCSKPSPEPISIAVPEEAPEPAAATAKIADSEAAVAETPEAAPDDEEIVFRSNADLGVDWLIRHQFDDGHWQFDHSPRSVGPTTGTGRARSNMTATAMAVLALQAHAIASPSERVKAAIEKALAWIVDHQQTDDSLVATGDEQPDMAHALATIAVCQGFRETQARVLERSAKAAIAFSAKKQLSGGGWPVGPGDEQGSLENTTWHLLAIRAGESIGVPMPEDTAEKCRSYLERLRSGDHRERFGRQQGAFGPSATDDRLDTAIGQFCLLLLGTTPEDPAVLAGADYLNAWPISIDRRDCLYWLFATQVLHSVGGYRWDNWDRSLQSAIRLCQVTEEGTDLGSWDPLRPTRDVHATFGGRHMVTCCCLLAKLVEDRNLHSFIIGTDPDA